jgi:hypothetical protein
LEIELFGDLAGILALSAGSKKPVAAGRDGLQVTLVAGARNNLYRTTVFYPFRRRSPYPDHIAHRPPSCESAGSTFYTWSDTTGEIIDAC